MEENMSMSIDGRDGCMQAKDKRIEYMHAEATDFNVDPNHSVEDILFFTEYFEEMDHINKCYNQMLGLENSTPMEARKGFRDTVAAMTKWLEMRIDLHSSNLDLNPFTGFAMDSGDYRIKKPWLYHDQIANGQAGPIGYPTSKWRWSQVVGHVMRKPMFDVGPATQTSYEADEGDFEQLDNVWGLDWGGHVVDLDQL
jgi:hypothetical protein